MSLLLLMYSVGTESFCIKVATNQVKSPEILGFFPAPFTITLTSLPGVYLKLYSAVAVCSIMLTRELKAKTKIFWPGKLHLPGKAERGVSRETN